MGLCYIVVNDETGLFLKGLDSSDLPLYTDDLKHAAVVDDFVCHTYWQDHTPATVNEDEMLNVFGEVRKPLPFRELRIAEENIQKKLKREERPGLIARLVAWWKRSRS